MLIRWAIDMKKILILGGFGFLGKNLNLEFKNKNYNILNVSRRNGCDLLNYSNFKEVLLSFQPDIVINCAAHVGSMNYVSQNSATVCHDNALMYINLYKGIASVNPAIKVINPISNCSYPGIIDIQHEELWWNGQIHPSVEAYGTPKKLGFILSETYKKQYGIKTTNLIVSNAYGPHDYADVERTHAMNGIIIRMIKQIKNNEKEFVVWGSGTPIREWVYMPDVAKIINEVIEKDPVLPNPINLGQERGISILDTVNMVKELLQYDFDIKLDTTKQDGAPVKILGNKQFKKHFKDFNFTDYNVGIAETINYYKEIL